MERTEFNRLLGIYGIHGKELGKTRCAELVVLLPGNVNNEYDTRW